jgi:hypothetical protein
VIGGDVRECCRAAPAVAADLRARTLAHRRGPLASGIGNFHRLRCLLGRRYLAIRLLLLLLLVLCETFLESGTA